MNKKILILIILFLMTGCWNYQELNSLAITTAMAIDLTDEGEYEVSLLIANSRKAQTSSQENESQTVIYSGKGNTITQALKEIDLINPRQSYIGHVSIVIICEDVAEKGMKEILDFLVRNSESTKRFQFALARDAKAKDIIKVLTPLETFPAQNISDNIKVSHESQATSTSVRYSEFVYTLLEKGINPILPSVMILGDEKDGSKDKSLQQTIPDAIIKLGTLGIFKEDKLVAYASKNASKGINIIRDAIEEMNIYLKCGKNNLTVKILQLKTNTKLKLDDIPSIELSISSMGTIFEDNCKHDLNDEKTIKKIEKLAEAELKKLVKEGIETAKDNKTDIFGFGNLIYKNNPDFYKKYNNWDNDGFTDLKINIKTNVDLKFKGSAKQSIKEAMDED